MLWICHKVKGYSTQSVSNESRIFLAVTLKRYRVRLVIRGCAQVEGINYYETYLPIIRYASIRFLCALAAKYDLHMKQMDVTAAYLHGNIKENMYVRPPKEMIKPGDEEKVWKLKRYMYGLKQNGQAWNGRLNDT